MRLRSIAVGWILFAGLFLVMWNRPLCAGERVSLVKDLNSTKGVDDLTLVRAGNQIFFQNYDPAHGVELWETDGTLAGTQIVADIRAGRESSSPRDLMAAGPLLYFTAEDDLHKRGLWHTDGTAKGTELILPFEEVGFPKPEDEEYVAAGANLYFRAWGRFWGVDGKNGGAVKLLDLRPGAWKYDQFLLGSVGATVFFSTLMEDQTNALWKTDGTASGTLLVKCGKAGENFYILPPSSMKPVVVESRLFFWTGDNIQGRALWGSDGTESGTRKIRSIPAPGNLAGPAVLGSLLLFTFDKDGKFQLWRSDGTEEGTVPVGETRTEPWNPFLGVKREFVTAGPRVYFPSAGPDHGVEIWTSDGMASGTLELRDVYAGEACSWPSHLTPLGSMLLFFANDGIHNGELWRTDGTASGTLMLKDIYPGGESSLYLQESPPPCPLPSLNGRVFFGADDGVGGFALWTSDGASTGTKMLGDVFSGSRSSQFSEIRQVGSSLILETNNLARSESETWISDGTPQGTKSLTALAAGAEMSYAHILGSVDSAFFFSAYDRGHGYELWKTDGTVSGTGLLKDIVPGNISCSPAGFARLESTFFFTAAENTQDRFLWKSDGTAPGTMRMLDHDGLPVQVRGSSNLAAAGSRVYFIGYNDLHGNELWMTDGTTSGTRMLRDMTPGIASTEIRFFRTVRSTLLFITDYCSLWKTDGTEAGTACLLSDSYKSLAGGMQISDTIFLHWYSWQYGSKPNYSTVNDIYSVNIDRGSSYIMSRTGSVRAAPGPVGGVLLFACYHNLVLDLYRTNGTKAGTTRVRSLSDYYDCDFMQAGSRTFITLRGANGTELWVSDGTEPGTVRIKTIETSSGEEINRFSWAAIDSVLFFRAYLPAEGTELWRSDGTPVGTRSVADIFPGGGTSDPGYLTPFDSSLYFVANDGIWGSELWKISPSLPSRVEKGWYSYR